MKKRAIMVFLFLASAFVLFAAGQQDTSAAGQGESGTQKNSVIVANAAEPTCFFPFHSKLTTGMGEVPILHNIYETPIKLMPDGTKEPLLAESWEISDDGKDYTLHLRKGVTFSNGNPMNADDVVFTLDSSAASTQGKTQLSNYDYTEKVDDYTVIVHLTGPYAPFENSLAGRFALIVDKETFEKVGEDGYNENPVGTGPYKFVKRIAGDRIMLESNENYWGGAPPTKHITYRVMTDTNTQMLALENGEVDVLLNANINQLLQLPEDSFVKWDAAEAASVAIIAFNCAKGPAADENFRKAVQSAINRDDIILGVYEGHAEPTQIYMTKSFTGRPNDADLIQVPYDPEKAKEYLAASNYKGEDFSISVTAGTKEELTAQIAQGQLLEIGINCTVNVMDKATYSDNVYWGTGEFGAFCRAMGVSILDADGYYTWFHRSVLGDRYNMGWYSNKLEALLDAGRIEPDPAKRKAIYTDVCNYITEHAYEVPLYSGLSLVAYNRSLHGVEPRALTGLYFFNDWSW